MNATAREPPAASANLADILLISQQEKINGMAAYQALRHEAEQCCQRGANLTLPRSFEAPGTDWHDKYPSAASLVLGLQGCRAFPQAAQAARTFLDPLLDGTVKGDWDPTNAAWQRTTADSQTAPA